MKQPRKWSYRTPVLIGLLVGGLHYFIRAGGGTGNTAHSIGYMIGSVIGAVLICCAFVAIRNLVAKR